MFRQLRDNPLALICTFLSIVIAIALVFIVLQPPVEGAAVSAAAFVLALMLGISFFVLGTSGRHPRREVEPEIYLRTEGRSRTTRAA